MTHARRALAAALVVSGFRTVGAEPCAPRASLAGDTEAIARVSAELSRLGVQIGAGDGRCRSVTAAVELERDGAIAVAVRDGTKRSEGRVVSDAALAAAWIDSWLHDDFEAPAAAPAMMPAAPPGPVAPPTDEIAKEAPAADLFERFTLAASYELAWTDASSRWSGFGASACVRVGELCLGARARYVQQDVLSNLSEAARSDVSVLATASWSRQVGTMSIAPELGLGVGRMTTERVDGCNVPPLTCDPTTDPNCKPPPPPPCTPVRGGTTAVYVGDGFAASTVTPRAEAALRLAIPLFSHVWLDGTASVTLAPFGHGDPYPPTSLPPPGTTPMDIVLPGEPLASFAIGIGLRVGGP